MARQNSKTARRQAFQRELEKLEGDAFQLPQTPTESGSSIEAY